VSETVLFEEQAVIDIITRLTGTSSSATGIEVSASSAERNMTGMAVSVACPEGVFWVRYFGSESKSTTGLVLKFLIEIGSASYPWTMRLARLAQASLVKFRTQGSSIEFESESVSTEGIIKQIYTVARPSVFTRDITTILTM